jgi:Fic family protein
MIVTSSLQITPELLALVAEIDEFKGAWWALGTLAPERLLMLRRVATIESIASSTRIEGSRLSDREVERLLGNLEIKTFSSRDEQEVAGYADVMETIFSAWAEIPIAENYIKQIHRDLLQYSEKDEWHRGHYKTASNSVAAFDAAGQQVGIIFETATPFETPKQMSELVTWFTDSLQEHSLHPLITIGIFVVVFLAIHPFQDGNGRLSRILTTLLLLQAGYAYVPYSSMESIIEQRKEHYYLSLRRTQGTIRDDAPDWLPWLLFFLRTLHRQMQILRSKIEQEKILLTKLPELSIQILEMLKVRGRITIGDAVILTGVSRNTLKLRFKHLLAEGFIELHGKGRGSWYSLSSSEIQEEVSYH